MKNKLLSAAVAAAFIPSMALADWQSTSWGMSVEEVQSVVGTDLIVFKADEVYETPFGDVSAFIKYETAGLKGYVSFAFDSEKLAGVVFAFSGKDDQAVFAMLQDQYGAPDQIPSSEDRRELIWFWRDEATENNIRFVHYPASLEPDLIIYSPIRSAEQSGL